MHALKQWMNREPTIGGKIKTKLMGQKQQTNQTNKTTDGNVELLASNNEAFDVDDQLPNEYVIDLTTTLQALRKVKTNKATGPLNVPASILKNHANILAGPLNAIFDSSLREGIIPETWKSANVIPVPKANPPNTIENDVRPISLTPIASKTLESIILNMVNEKIKKTLTATNLVEWERLRQRIPLLG